jgi:tetratricopeptide (TPR) repeat protein
MSDRLTRKEIKQQDQFQTTVGRVLEGIQTYRRQIVMAAIALVVVVVAAVAVILWLESREAAAQEVLTEALDVTQAPVGEEPPGLPDWIPTFDTVEARTARSVELFQQLIDDYGSTDAGQMAHLYLGEIEAERGNADAAREHWREFLASADEERMLAARARLNLIALDRQAGNDEAVIESLRTELDTGDSALPEDVVLYELAGALEAAGQEQEADELYQRLVDEHSSSPYAQVARTKVGPGAGGLSSADVTRRLAGG